MSAPPGYTNQQLILADGFVGADLDTQKWSTYLGAQGIIWNDYGRLLAPYSAPNASPLEDELAMFGPSQVSVHNGLTLTAQANTTRFAKTYPWISGVVTTEGKVSLPATGWYVQVKAKMPDMTAGMWPAIWFMPDTATSRVPEIDLFEGGWKSADPNETMHADYGGGASQYAGYRDIVYDTGSDLAAGYHVYGIQYIPNVSVKYFFDGKMVFEQLASDKGGVAAGTYELLLQLQVASAQTSQWHTVPTAATPSESMEVAEVQAYS
jgi:beta-glucanase (GH16 family)